MSNVRPLPNINGSSAQALIDQACEIALALEKIQDQVRLAFPHGRDYIHAPHGQLETDRQLIRERLQTLNALSLAYQRDAIYIDSLRR